MERKRAVIYSHALYEAENAIKNAEEIGRTMQTWASEQGMIPVAIIIEISNQCCDVCRPGLNKCTAMVLNGDADVAIVFCKSAISSDTGLVMDFIVGIEEEDGKVISLRNDLPNEYGPYRFELEKPKSEMISFAKIINLV